MRAPIAFFVAGIKPGRTRDARAPCRSTPVPCFARSAGARAEVHAASISHAKSWRARGSCLCWGMRALRQDMIENTASEAGLQSLPPQELLQSFRARVLSKKRDFVAIGDDDRRPSCALSATIFRTQETSGIEVDRTLRMTCCMLHERMAPLYRPRWTAIIGLSPRSRRCPAAVSFLIPMRSEFKQP